MAPRVSGEPLPGLASIYVNCAPGGRAAGIAFDGAPPHLPCGRRRALIP